jgi:hypothetical protein
MGNGVALLCACNNLSYMPFLTSCDKTPFLSNVVVECLKLLLRIQEVPDSNLSKETGYPD